jgi:hypothetical protein
MLFLRINRFKFTHDSGTAFHSGLSLEPAGFESIEITEMTSMKTRTI